MEEYWQTFLDLRAEGKIRAAGLSNHNVAQLTAAEALGHVDSLQPQFSLIHRDAAAELIPWCAEHGTGVIVYASPNIYEILRDEYPAIRTFENRSITPTALRVRWRPNVAWALLAMALFITALARINAPSPFLYGGF